MNTTKKETKLTNNLKALRKSLGLTQQEVADALGTTQQSITRWEAGRSEPNIFWLKALSTFFRVSIDTLVKHQPKGSSKNA